MFSELDKELEFLEIRIQQIKKEFKDIKVEVKDLEEWLDELRIQRKMTHEAIKNGNKSDQALEEIENKGKQVKTQLLQKQQEKIQTFKLLNQLQQDYHDKLYAKNCLLAEQIKTKE
jgi:hypothetical protein